MNKAIIVSLAIIGVVGVVATGATISYFSDLETSTAIMDIGVIDIVVNDQNPWEQTYTAELLDMKPCQTRWIGFTVRNSIFSNPINIWKHIHITEQNDGYITEPECEEGGGTWTGGEEECTDPASCCTTDSGYTPNNNVAAYTIYDMWICYDPVEGQRCTTTEDGEPSYGGNWIPIIREEQFVRLDNVSSAWIYLGKLDRGEKMMVVQSYHLRSWPDSPLEVTNWAQGDQLKFNIDIMGTQIDGPGPKGYQTTLVLDNKTTNWVPIDDDIKATMTYKTSGEKFDYSLAGTVKNTSTEYCLIYYADPWPGDGTDHSTGALIGKATSDGSGNISIGSTQIELGTDLPNSKDQNYPGAKVWLIPCTHYNTATPGAQGKMIEWTHSEYLFDMNLITYDDTDV